jgi:uncharacterized 2Fe-2S/4Fe-4S cluster protein (DUF4445 family)
MPPAHPVVRKVYLDLPQPSLKDNTADLDRLKKQVRQTLAIENLLVPFALIPQWVSLLRSSAYRVTASVSLAPPIPHLIDVEAGDTSSRLFGLAVDLGTTRLAYQLWDLKEGRLLDETGSDNPQIRYGADILTRIHRAGTPEGLQGLKEAVIGEINRVTQTLCQVHNLSPREILAVTVAGNTTMTHLFLGLDPSSICREPYIPKINSLDPLTAQELGLDLHPRAWAYVFPNVGSYLGGDVLAGILHSGLYQQEGLSLLVDVGTNAEVVLGNAEWLIGCAGAAGPALEGGVARMGMTAAEGAIDRVRIDPRTQELTYTVIGGGRPVGICGSGLIDLTAELFTAGIIDLRGKLNRKKAGRRWTETDGQPAFLVVPAEETAHGQAIVLSQVDLDVLLRSKAAMYTILTTLTQTVGYDLKDIERFYVAGAFGNHIDPRRAVILGMLPDLPLERYIPLGNTSLKGAADVLLDAGKLAEVKKIAERITYLEMNVNQDFMNRFSAARFIPHTDPSLFPSVPLNRD